MHGCVNAENAFVGDNAYRTTELSSGNPLKNARLISSTVTSTRLITNDDGINAHVMQWGHLITLEFSQIRGIQGSQEAQGNKETSGCKIST